MTWWSDPVFEAMGCQRRGCEVVCLSGGITDPLYERYVFSHSGHPEAQLVIQDCADYPQGWEDIATQKLVQWARSLHDYEDGKLSYLRDADPRVEGKEQIRLEI